jgi:DnaJ-class molecular chaperone
MPKRDYYEALGVRRDASADEIRQAYRRLAREYHPDVNKSDDAAQCFAEVSEAYEVLGDAEKRQKYDRFGTAAFGATGGPAGGGPAPDFSDFGSFFEEMFGRRGDSPFAAGHTHRPGPVRGRDVEQTLTVSFMTAALGGEERLRFATQGSEPRTVTVKIPPGVEKGSRLRIRGRGQPGMRDGAPGDLLLTLEVGTHPHFRRDGLTVLIEVPITIAEAALGTTVRVPLLRGSAEIRIPPGASSGRKLRIPGKGVVDPAGKAGDFLAVVQIVAPEALSDEARTHLEALGPELKNPRETGPWADMKDATA